MTETRTLESAVALLQGDARQRGVSLTKQLIEPVLCEDGKTVMIYVGENMARWFGPMNAADFDPPKIVCAVLAHLKSNHLCVVR